MKRISKRTLGIVLALLLMVSAICVGNFSAVAADKNLENSGARSSSGDTIYVTNYPSGWTTLYAYMWDTENGNANNGTFPGQKMEDEGDGVWSYHVTGTFNKIIFGNGDSGSGNQSGDLDYAGDGMIYDYAADKWDTYDTSALKISKFEADMASPQYKDTAITFEAAAKSSASLIQYQFSVNGTVMQAYSTNTKYTWTPASTGTFTIKLEVKDNAGNQNSRELTYVINDPSQEVRPVFQSATPSSSTQVKLNASTNISIKASGGNTGTKLLFYKYVVKNPSGTQVNTAYYTLNKTYSFTPTVAGDYTVEVTIQGSDNQTATKTLKYTATNNPVTSESVPTSSSKDPDGEKIMGDVDGNGVLDVSDARLIQRYVTHFELNVFKAECADIDGNGKIQISDATYIQKKIAGVI